MAAIFNSEKTALRSTSTGAGGHTYDGVRIIKEMVSPNPMTRWAVSKRKKDKRERALDGSYIEDAQQKFAHIQIPKPHLNVALERQQIVDDCRDILQDHRSAQKQFTSPVFINDMGQGHTRQ